MSRFEAVRFETFQRRGRRAELQDDARARSQVETRAEIAANARGEVPAGAQTDGSINPQPDAPTEIRCYVCGAPARSERVLVDVPAALRICKVGRSTLYRWMSEGLVEWAGLPDGSRGIFLDTLFRDRMRRP